MNKQLVKIRYWNENDFQDVYKILNESWHKAYSSFIPTEDLDLYLNNTYNITKLRELLNNDNIICYSAIFDNIIVGWLKLIINKNENRIYLSSIYVLPKYQKLKIGRQLMDIAFSEAKDNGFSEIWIGVMENNIKVLGWYEKMGFEFGENLPFRMGKTTVNHFIGVKKDL